MEQLVEWCCQLLSWEDRNSSCYSRPSSVLTSSMKSAINFNTTFQLSSEQRGKSWPRHSSFEDCHKLPNLAYVPWRWETPAPALFTSSNAWDRASDAVGAPHTLAARWSKYGSHHSKCSGIAPWSCQLLRISCHPQDWMFIPQLAI